MALQLSSIIVVPEARDELALRLRRARALCKVDNDKGNYSNRIYKLKSSIY